MISKELSLYLKYLILFLIVALLIAPLCHEFIHITVLAFYGCNYTFSFAFDWIFGFNMMFVPLCKLSTIQSIVALSSTFFGDFMIVFILFLLTYLARMKGKIKLSNYLIYVAMGFLTMPVFSLILIRGNIIDILNLSGHLLWALPLIGFGLLILALLYFWVHISSPQQKKV